MFKSLTLKNFRKHRDLTINFQGGLEGIVGANEGGKTTITEGLAYALFGTKALRDSLDACVTYDEAVNSLKATTVFEVEGTTYTVARGKSGAELTYDGGSVTGQTEVSNYVAKILGFDLNGAGSLVIAGQNSIRGALEEGPKAATELIERLADFQQIDDLIELLQAKLALGSGAALEARLASAQATVDTLAAQPAPDTAELEAKHEALEAELVTLEAASDAAEAAHTAARSKSDVAAVQAKEFASRTADVANAKLDVERARSAALRAEDAAKAATPNYDVDERIASLEGSKKRQDAAAECSKLYAQVKPLLTYSGDVFEGTEADLQKHIDGAQATLTKAQADRTKALSRIDVLKATVQAGSCSLCGKDVSEVPEVVAKNAKLTTEIASLLQLAKNLDAQAVDMEEDLVAHLNVQHAARPYLAMAARGLEEVKVSTGEVPPTLTWVGPDVSGPANGTDYAAKIAAERKAQRDLTVIMAALNSANDALALRVDRSIAAEKALAGCQSVDPTQAEADTREAALRLSGARQDVRAVEDSIRMLVNGISRIQADWDFSRRDLVRAQDQVTTLTNDLKVLAFNNALLKRVREVRPVLADKVWGLVLGSISKFFSDMRGQGSVVTKGGDGFMVDGHTVKSLSGSTLDILGLAIRCSLLRMFRPTCSFLVLDEPFHGCADDRSQAMLAFLQGLGFSQVLLVTHEESTMSVADNLISV